MAINLEIIESIGSGREPGQRNVDIELPAVAITNITAAGVTALQTTTRRVILRNRAGGDSIYARVQLATSSTQAAAGNSFLIAAGESVSFTLPKFTGGLDGADYEVDVRAIA